jgi:hypothetical protein
MPSQRLQAMDGMVAHTDRKPARHIFTPVALSNTRLAPHAPRFSDAWSTSKAAQYYERINKDVRVRRARGLASHQRAAGWSMSSMLAGFGFNAPSSMR